MARVDRTVPGGAVLLGAVRPPRPRVTGLAGDGTDLFEPGSQVSPFCGGLRRHGPWVRARAILLCPWRIASLRLWLDVEARRTAFTTVTAGGVASGGCTASFRHRPRSRALHVRRRRRPVLKAAGWSTCTPCRGQRRRAARDLRLQVTNAEAAPPCLKAASDSWRLARGPSRAAATGRSSRLPAASSDLLCAAGGHLL